MRFLAIALFAGGSLSATLLPTFSLEDLVNKSDRIVSGRIVKTWISWDARHSAIWTRYQLQVDEVISGLGSKHDEIIVSEPGGTLDGEEMRVADAVRYDVGDKVILFLRHFSTGEWRTVGWSQGKFIIDSAGTIRTAGANGANVLASPGAGRGTPLRSLDGLPASQVRQKVRAILAPRGQAK